MLEDDPATPMAWRRGAPGARDADRGRRAPLLRITTIAAPEPERRRRRHDAAHPGVDNHLSVVVVAVKAMPAATSMRDCGRSRCSADRGFFRSATAIALRA
jgi:hypothetical protein